jgi:hypothetical protein
MSSCPKCGAAEEDRSRDEPYYACDSYVGYGKFEIGYSCLRNQLAAIQKAKGELEAAVQEFLHPQPKGTTGEPSLMGRMHDLDMALQQSRGASNRPRAGPHAMSDEDDLPTEAELDADLYREEDGL